PEHGHKVLVAQQCGYRAVDRATAHPGRELRSVDPCLNRCTGLCKRLFAGTRFGFALHLGLASAGSLFRPRLLSLRLTLCPGFLPARLAFLPRLLLPEQSGLPCCGALIGLFGLPHRAFVFSSRSSERRSGEAEAKCG